MLRRLRQLARLNPRTHHSRPIYSERDIPSQLTERASKRDANNKDQYASTASDK